MNALTKLIRAVFIMILIGNIMTATAQSATPAKPAAAPTPPSVGTVATKKDPAPIPTGTIKGRIVATDGQPLTNATIVAQALTGAPATKPTRPDAEGRFVFDELAPGTYLIIGTAPGYIDQSRALGDVSMWPRHLIGSNVKITMIKGGVITGLVSNAKGEPLVGVPVRATMTNPDASILGFFNGNGASETDDRGSYRIYGLLPGQYIVSAGGGGAFGRFTPSGFDRDVPTYYPASPRDTAVPVSVRSGDDTSGIDIKYRGSDGHSLSGFILGEVPKGAMNGAVTIILTHTGTSSVVAIGLAGANANDPRRAFSFNGIADGEYELFANYLTSPTENAVAGEKHVTLRGGDVTGIEVRLTLLGSLAGTMALDPIKPEDKCDKRGSQVVETILRLPSDDPKKILTRSPAAIYSGLGQLNDKGEFILHSLVAARYRLDIKLPTESWYVRAINLPAATRATQTSSPTAQPVVANSNAWQGVVNIKSGENPNGLSIMLGQDAAGLRGRVGPAGTTIREGTRVHLVPVEREQANNILRYSETSVNGDGSFALTNLALGRYLILSRVEAPTDPDTPSHPIAWDAAARAKLRRDAEAANTIIELKPCQQLIDYELKIVP